MTNEHDRKTETANSTFRISSSPVVSTAANSDEFSARELEQLNELPRSYGESIVFAMARDPKTLFVYWEIDWPEVFAQVAPANRNVYLRVYDSEGSELSQTSVEAMARSCEVTLIEPAGSVRIELGYFDRNQRWHAVGTSEIVRMPPDKIGALSPGDFALVPFHITFQRLTELFRATRSDQGSLTQSLVQLHERFLNPEEHGSLAPEEREIYRAMKATMSERSYLRRASLDRASELQLQKKLESILGFGARASSHSLGESTKV
jgi:hypothetical protein